jgi:hypothetical protein
MSRLHEQVFSHWYFARSASDAAGTSHFFLLRAGKTLPKSDGRRLIVNEETESLQDGLYCLDIRMHLHYILPGWPPPLAIPAEPDIRARWQKER